MAEVISEFYASIKDLEDVKVKIPPGAQPESRSKAEVKFMKQYRDDTGGLPLSTWAALVDRGEQLFRGHPRIFTSRLDAMAWLLIYKCTVPPPRLDTDQLHHKFLSMLTNGELLRAIK